MLFLRCGEPGDFGSPLTFSRQATTSSETNSEKRRWRQLFDCERSEMPQPRIAAYGSWSSPTTSDLIVASTIGLGELMLDGADLYWIESRPQESGRSVIVRRAANGTMGDVTPPGFNVRTRVHEYGGGAYLVGDGVVYFANDADQCLYRQEPGAAPVALTPGP